MTLDFDFKNDLKVLIEQKIQSEYGHNLQFVDLEDALLSLGSFYRRIPLRRKWLVRESDTFDSCGHEDVINTIKIKLSTGDDIGPYLSRSTNKPTYQDMLLNNWGILHLHLGETIESDGYISRTENLLYCKFDSYESIAYFITIKPHGYWTNKYLLEIVDRNWPESIKDFCIEEAKLITPEPNEKELWHLSINKINTFIEVNGKVYSPPGLGHAADGSALIDVLYMQQAVKLLDCIPEMYQLYLEEIEAKLRSQTKHKRVQIHLTGFKIKDEKFREIHFKAVANGENIPFTFILGNNDDS